MSITYGFAMKDVARRCESSAGRTATATGTSAAASQSVVDHTPRPAGKPGRIEGDKTMKGLINMENNNATGGMKRLWKFELTLEDKQRFYVGADGNPDSVSMFVAEEDAAKQEAARRVFEFEKVYGVTPASVRYESHGKANTLSHRPNEPEANEGSVG